MTKRVVSSDWPRASATATVRPARSAGDLMPDPGAATSAVTSVVYPLTPFFMFS